LKKFVCTTLSVLFLAFALAGCGGGSIAPQPKPPQAVTMTASQVFNRSMIGQTWTFQDTYGDTMWIEIQQANFCEAGICDGKSVLWHYTKSNARGYWQPGFDGAENWFILHEESDGSWRCVVNKVNMPVNGPFPSSPIATQDPLPVGQLPLPYVIVPANDLMSVHTSYTSWWEIGVLTDDLVTPNYPIMDIKWSTTSGVEKVTTPLTGTVDSLISEQFENTVHEKWNFCPGVGLCAVTPYNDGRTDLDPNLRMVRIK
jgi:hypothetical protein